MSDSADEALVEDVEIPSASEFRAATALVNPQLVALKKYFLDALRSHAETDTERPIRIYNPDGYPDSAINQVLDQFRAKGFQVYWDGALLSYAFDDRPK